MTRQESWGRHPRLQPARTVALRDRNAPLLLPDTAPMLAYGNGRSYGDACQNANGILLLTRGLDRFIVFDRDNGTLRCEAGVLLSEILDLVVPAGWFLPVVPGTSAITVGGAIANDVHGKNHHVAGGFGRHVSCFELLRSDGSRQECSTVENVDLFAATIGGLGLTGLITWAEIRLQRLPSPWLEVDTIRFSTLPEFFALSETAAPDFAYTVAWLDGTATSERQGRGVFTRANPADAAATGALPKPRSVQLAVPIVPPATMLPAWAVRRFNEARFARAREGRTLQHYRSFFFPLDAIGYWNRLYGPNGFVQHQSVLPPQAATEAVEALMRSAAVHGGAFLAVLKQFGNAASPGMMSFPRPGTTLALDFPFREDRTPALLQRLDDIVADAGGAIYPAKDSHMSAAHFRQFFPRMDEFAIHVDPAFSSSLWRRVNPHR